MCRYGKVCNKNPCSVSIRKGYVESGRTAVAALARLECYYFSVESVNNICIIIKEVNRYLGILVVTWLFEGLGRRVAGVKFRVKVGVAKTPHPARRELSLFSQHQENGRGLTEFIIRYCEWMLSPSTFVGFGSL